jgi:chromosome segregation ATPase
MIQLSEKMLRVEKRLEHLRKEDEALAARETAVKNGNSDTAALAAVRGGVGASILVGDSEIEMLAAARRALASEINSAKSEIASFGRSIDRDRTTMRELGERVIANGARIDGLLHELNAALEEGSSLYNEARTGGFASRLGRQEQLQHHLGDMWRVSSAFSHQLRDVAMSPHLDVPHSVERYDRSFFKQFES